MSSEQLRSERLDNRTDLFSLGSVLYEMITGRLAFPGPSGAAIVDSVINRVPLPPSRLNPDIPAKPAGVSDACYTKEGQKITDMQRCTRMFPVYANPRLNAGQPISDDAEVRAQADRQERLLGSARIRATRQAERGFPLGRIRGSRTS
jgi:serine/threonine protein kinase